jgi:hypothetical protein
MSLSPPDLYGRKIGLGRLMTAKIDAFVTGVRTNPKFITAAAADSCSSGAKGGSKDR